ncbi:MULTISPECIES: hypothetical protein [Streptomyces]|uniref:hypothetical protein n=1 Tax=Streptomyces TaxID=1883 RepID=UPI000823EAA4|nr:MULTISPECIES: hypothetical protein [Streptomyces]MCX4652188.1 hypothetical protein [Streptomyces microflavus]WSA60535.1 hypothetical protein OHB31_10280 [Streptomyces microflavus]WSS36892.1 hypothetical protein OG269_27155 [Streptomyces microflavus]WST14657.1 hypothetical protein OG721_11985 [Streptomyces microflavus]SCK19170.1 hypothetical protein YUYDRAFT_01943 [Streptomyces sp. ScaeMP-e48]
MAYLFLFGCFLLLGVAGSLAARVGYRGKVCDGSVGYEVPAAVKSDPALRKRANDLVAFWCTGAAILSFAPLVPLGSVILSGGGKAVSTWGLVAFAAYGLVIATVGGYPFEKIKQLGASVER